LGTDTAKERLMGLLKQTELGPGYCHFPINRDEEYFRQLTAEEQITKFNRGAPYLAWQKIYARNEALDCRVYNMAALQIANLDLQLLAAEMKQPADPPPQKADVKEEKSEWLPDKNNWWNRR